MDPWELEDIATKPFLLGCKVNDETKESQDDYKNKLEDGLFDLISYKLELKSSTNNNSNITCYSLKNGGYFTIEFFEKPIQTNPSNSKLLSLDNYLKNYPKQEIKNMFEKQEGISNYSYRGYFSSIHMSPNQYSIVNEKLNEFKLPKIKMIALTTLK